MELTETPEERKRRLQKIRNARWKEKHPTGGRDASRRWRAKNPGYTWPGRLALVAEVDLLKSAPCLDCGGKFPPECMDFDHVRGEKTLAVGTMVSSGRTREKVLEEIAKCELVCSNCHRIRTRKRGKL